MPLAGFANLMASRSAAAIPLCHRRNERRAKSLRDSELPPDRFGLYFDNDESAGLSCLAVSMATPALHGSLSLSR
jgi:hypothetical protein